MGIDFSNSMTPTQTGASITRANHAANYERAMGEELPNSLEVFATTPGLCGDPTGHIDPRTGKWSENGGTLVERAFCKRPGADPKEAVGGDADKTIGEAKVEKTDPNKRPATLPDHLGQAAYLET